MLWAFRLLNFFAIGMLALFHVSLICAQQSGQSSQQGKKPAAPTIESFPEPAKNVPQQQVLSVPAFAARLIQLLGPVDCRKQDCTILVADFDSSEGFGSPYGRRLADELSAEIARQKESFHMVDRALLAGALAKLEEERVPGAVRHCPAVLRWLGQELNASLVLAGEVEDHTSRGVQVSAQFLKVQDRKAISPNDEVTLPLPSAVGELYASEPLRPPPAFPETINGEHIYQAGQQGVGIPKCHYMPNPPYTDEARRFNLSGSLVIEGVVDTHGTVRNPRIVRGLPFGLNEITARTLSTWKCDPALMNGQPVSTFVPFEVTFHLY